MAGRLLRILIHSRAGRRLTVREAMSYFENVSFSENYPFGEMLCQVRADIAEYFLNPEDPHPFHPLPPIGRG